MVFITVNGYMRGELSEWATSIGNKVSVHIWGPSGYSSQVCIVYLIYAYFLLRGDGEVGQPAGVGGQQGGGAREQPRCAAAEQH